MCACQSLPIGYHSNAWMRKAQLPRLISTPTFPHAGTRVNLSKMWKKPCGNKRMRTREYISIIQRIIYRNSIKRGDKQLGNKQG